MLTVQEIFDRYQAIRGRLPETAFPGRTKDIRSLMDIADHVDAFVFDAFGVLNVGETPIPGAAARLDALRAHGCAIRVLSNAASYNHAGAVEKFRKLGLNIRSNEIITSRDAALAALDDRVWGCIAAPADDLSDIPGKTVRLGDDQTLYDQAEGFLFLSSDTWSLFRQAVLRQTLSQARNSTTRCGGDFDRSRTAQHFLKASIYRTRDEAGFRYIPRMAAIYSLSKALTALFWFIVHPRRVIFRACLTRCDKPHAIHRSVNPWEEKPIARSADKIGCVTVEIGETL